MVAPSREDPAARAASAAIGGPPGDHSRGHRWWIPVRVILAITALTCALGMLQKTHCADESWLNGQERYSAMCYSDLPYLYTGRGLAELSWPYSDDEQTRLRYPVMEYPVTIAYFAYGTAWITQMVSGADDVDQRRLEPTDMLSSDPQIQDEMRTFVIVSSLFFAACALLTAWLLSRTHRHRPWDAVMYAASPALLLTGLINWDLLAVACVAGAMWAWSRDKPVLTGALIGLGTATKLYPLFLLGAVLVICLRRREWRPIVSSTLAAVVVWLLANAPAYLSGRDEWKVFWTFNSERGADLGSIWLVIEQAGHQVSAHEINLISWVFFIGWCVAVLAIGLLAPETPRFAQLGFLIVAGFLLVNKVYSPQYVLWLLPLAVLARPRWRDQLIWQSGEVLYFAFVWWYLGGYLQPGAGSDAEFYWLAILVRMACEIYLVVIVVRDILVPWKDPVRWTELDQPDRAQASETRSNSVAV